MTRKLLVSGIAAAVAMAVLTPAQASAQSPWMFGIKGGLNINNVSYDVEDIDDDFEPDFESKAGPLGGVFARRDINDLFGVQVEGLVTRKGTRSGAFDIEGNFLEAEYAATYFEIPVLADFTLARADEATFRAYVGPSFAFRMSESFEVDGVESDEDPGVESTDVGLNVGANVSVRRWLFDVRYTHGLRNLEKFEPEAVDVKTRTFAFSVGYRFN
jgi:hypothetical protein